MKKKPTKQKLSMSNNTLRNDARWIEPHLRFSPTAWAKLLYFRDRGDTEIGGFGMTLAEDLLYVEDFVTVKQQVSIASVSFEDEAVADLFEDQVDQGRKPEQFARIWCHSHPGDCPNPSHTDEETFQRVFGRCDWAVMFIIARGGKTFCRLRFNVGPGGDQDIPVSIDYARLFKASEPKAWEVLYQEHIQMFAWPNHLEVVSDLDDTAFSGDGISEDLAEQLAEMEPVERRAVLKELSYSCDAWDEETEVFS